MNSNFNLREFLGILTNEIRTNTKQLVKYENSDKDIIKSDELQNKVESSSFDEAFPKFQEKYGKNLNNSENMIRNYKYY